MRHLTGPIITALACLPAFAAAEPHTLARADGTLIHYTIDRPDGDAAGLVLIAQGSGCLPGATNPALATVRAAFPLHAALIVEKIGVTPDSNIVDGSIDCPAAFLESYTASQRVEDYLAVVEHLEPDASLRFDRLVLYGGSEGGLAVARLATQLNPAATIIMSSGTGLTLADLIKTTVPPEGHAMLEAGFAAARAAPDSSEIFAGSSYKFWADIIDQRPLDYMLESRGALLLIQGGRDLSNPAAAARTTVDAFSEAGDCRLTYWEFPTLDHGMLMPSRASRLAVIAKRAAEWTRNPMPAC
ncbi:alpha/beta hydrolase family protein [Devosia sp. CAU 1758]